MRAAGAALLATLFALLAVHTLPAWAEESEEAAAGKPPWKERWSNGWRNVGSDARYLITFPTRPTRRGLARTGAVVGGVALLILLDDEIRDEVQETRNATWDRWENRIEPLGRAETTSLAAGLVYAAGTIGGNEKVTETGRTLIEALFFTEVFKSAGKGLTGRVPPGEGARAGEFFDGGTIFPSGHTARAFAFATVLSRRHGRKAAWVAYPLAGLVGLFRVVNDSHWASDVLAGAALGHAVGRAVARRRAERSESHRRVSFTPGITPDGRGPAFFLRVVF